MSTSNSMRRSTRTRRPPIRYNPCITKPCCSHIDEHSEKKELIPQPLPELDLTDTCCICMEVVDTKKNRVTTECGHTFCSSCLFRHLEENHQCPLCRFALRRPVKKTPTLNPPVAESLITGLSNSREEREGIETIAREMYIQVIDDLGQPCSDRESAWRAASSNIRSRMLQLLRGYQIMWGMNVCREISQWMHYVSTSPNGLPNLTELERQVNALQQNIDNVDNFINGPEDSATHGNVAINEPAPAIGLEVESVNELNDYINDSEEEVSTDPETPELEEDEFENHEFEGEFVSAIPNGVMEAPMTHLELIPLESDQAELSNIDRDVLNYIFEIHSNAYDEPIINHIEGQIINNIGIDRIISDAMNILNNVNHYRQTRR